MADEYQGYLIQGAKSKARIDALKKAKDFATALADKAKSAMRKSGADKLICEKLEFCERIESQHVKMAIDIADVIFRGKMILVGLPPVPPTKFAVYLIRTGLLDDLCQCKKAKK
jgi:hypothetical protein